MLGGVFRMPISTAVILIEATSNITYGLAIVIALMFAKWVRNSFVNFCTCFDNFKIGDLINDGFYDMHIKLRDLPMLPWEPPVDSRFRLTAEQVMNSNLFCLQQRHQV